MSSQNLGIPPELVHLALVWPIARMLHKARTHRILDDVMAFLMVTFVPPQLRIPEMTLPDLIWNSIILLEATAQNADAISNNRPDDP